MSSLVTSSIQNLGEYQGTVSPFNLNIVGKMETITIAPSTNMINYNLGVNTSNKVHSYVNINASATLYLSGIDTTNIEQNKKITLRNINEHTSNNSYVIAVNRLDREVSTTSNLIYWQSNSMPVFIMPGEEIEFEYKEGYWILQTGTRYGGGERGIFDECFDTGWYSLTTGNTGSATEASIYYRGYGGSLPVRVKAYQQGVTNKGDYSVWCAGYSKDIFLNRANCGCILVTGLHSYQARADSANDYIWFAGLHTNYSDTFSYEAAANVARGIGLIYNGVAANNFQFITRNNYTSTVSTGLHSAMPATDGYIRWFMFVNGDATRVDFCKAEDEYTEGAGTRNWRTFYTHTTNIPATSDPASLVGNTSLTLSISLAKTANTIGGGPGACNKIYTSTFGMMGKGTGIG